MTQPTQAPKPATQQMMGVADDQAGSCVTKSSGCGRSQFMSEYLKTPGANFDISMTSNSSAGQKVNNNNQSVVENSGPKNEVKLLLV